MSLTRLCVGFAVEPNSVVALRKLSDERCELELASGALVCVTGNFDDVLYALREEVDLEEVDVDG